ncbi:MAG: M48 family metalloprotease [Planctomycetes bacterium]|nr:M48 family metalloprotease [Planctomycetota bacterium]
MNQLKTILLLGVLSALLVSIGGLLGGGALPLFLTLALVMNLGAFLWSDQLVLRMSRARLVTEQEAPALHAMVAGLAHDAGLPMPRLAVVPDATPNAFATGRSPARAVVAVTEGLLRLVDPRELRGVLAHELAHVRHRDTLIATVAAAFSTAIAYAANALQWAAMFGGLGGDRDGDGEADSSVGGGLLAALFGPVVAMMLQAGISRSREFEADRYAAELTGDPAALADALRKLQQHGEAMLRRGAPQPQPATAALSIVNPLSGGTLTGGLFRLFATHPPVEARVQRLLAMTQRLGRIA